MGKEAEDGPSKLPHYALPNFSVVLPTYSNSEQDIITQAFRIGSCVRISALPNTIKAGGVSRSRYQRILDNRQSAEDWNVNPGAAYKPKTKVFSEFEYMPSPFSLVEELRHQERVKSEELMAAAGHTTPFRMADSAVKMKSEDAFEGGANRELRFNPYPDQADPYERADDQELRYKWLKDAQILSGPFRPAGRVKGQTDQSATELPSRATLPSMVSELRAAIEEDWADYSFLVCSTDDEHIVVRFDYSTLEAEPGLGAYMNVYARSNHVISKFGLKKVVEDWNVTPGDGYLYYTFRPPWVTSRITDTFFALHPEQRAYQDPRLKKRSESTLQSSFAAQQGIESSSSSAHLMATATGGVAKTTGETVLPEMA